MHIRLPLSAIAALSLSISAQASLVNIDLSGASSGSFIDGIGADFAQSFLGQTVSGNSLSGTPSSALSLTPAGGSIAVAFWDPGVAAASNSLLSQPGNAAPLAILLDSNANSFSWTMGSSEAGSSIAYSLFSASGALVGSGSVLMGSGYNNYSLTGLPEFRGIAFADDNDPAGVRFQNMSYNSVAPVPEPQTYALMAACLGILAAVTRRQKTGTAT